MARRTKHMTPQPLGGPKLTNEEEELLRAIQDRGHTGQLLDYISKKEKQLIRKYNILPFVYYQLKRKIRRLKHETQHLPKRSTLDTPSSDTPKRFTPTYIAYHTHPAKLCEDYSSKSGLGINIGSGIRGNKYNKCTTVLTLHCVNCDNKEDEAYTRDILREFKESMEDVIRLMMMKLKADGADVGECERDFPIEDMEGVLEDGEEFVDRALSAVKTAMGKCATEYKKSEAKKKMTKGGGKKKFSNALEWHEDQAGLDKGA